MPDLAASAAVPVALPPDQANASLIGRVVDFKSAGDGDRLVTLHIRERWFVNDTGGFEDLYPSIYILGRLLKNKSVKITKGVYMSVNGTFRVRAGNLEVMAHRVRTWRSDD